MAHTVGSEIVVGVGDCAVGMLPSTFLATYALGSCVAVVAWDWRGKVGGLLHAMLPDSAIDRSKAVASPAVYVDTGVQELFRQLEEKGGSRHSARFCLAGGASMMLDSSRFEIGKRNYLAVKKALRNMGVFIDQEDVGGGETRSLRLDLTTGRIDMRKGSGPGQVFVPGGIPLIGRGDIGRGENDGGTAG
jgi:chemotaxis protein CheD